MQRRRKLQLAIAAGVILLTRAAVADPAGSGSGSAGSLPPTAGIEHIESPSTLTTDGGSILRLPPGFFLDEPTYSKLDLEMRRLQDQETRLTAENASMKKSLSGWEPGWWVVAGTLATGIAAGWYLHDKL